MLSEFKVPGSDLPGLYYLRNTADADKMADAFKQMQGGKVRQLFIQS